MESDKPQLSAKLRTLNQANDFCRVTMQKKFFSHLIIGNIFIIFPIAVYNQK